MNSNPKVIRRIVKIGVCALAVLFLLALIGFFPWSPANCWHYEVDLHSGRIRYTRYFAFVQVSQRIDESALSRALQADDLRHAHEDWRRVLTLSPGSGHSPHYIFHSAIVQIRQLEMTWQEGAFTPAARRASAKHVLDLWLKEQTDTAVEPYLDALMELAKRSGLEKKSTDVEQLPEAPSMF